MRLLHLILLLGLLTIPACDTASTQTDPPVELAPARAEASDATIDRVCAIAAELLGVNRSQMTATTSLDDLGCDDLDIVELIMELEDMFEVSIPDDAINEMAGSDNWSEGMKSVTMQKLAEAVDACKS